MRIAITAFFWMIFVASTTFSVNAQNWRQLMPLHSTRAEVEHLLGVTHQAYSAQYQLKDGSLFIEYSSGPCRKEREGGYNVPIDVVIRLIFTPTVSPRFGT